MHVLVNATVDVCSALKQTYRNAKKVFSTTTLYPGRIQFHDPLDHSAEWYVF
jgi:hypothetical protein